MSLRVGKHIIIAVEPPQLCTECGQMAETRPYGKNMARICADCGEKHPERTEAMMKKVLFGEGVRDDN